MDQPLLALASDAAAREEIYADYRRILRSLGDDRRFMTSAVPSPQEMSLLNNRMIALEGKLNTEARRTGGIFDPKDKYVMDVYGDVLTAYDKFFTSYDAFLAEAALIPERKLKQSSTPDPIHSEEPLLLVNEVDPAYLLPASNTKAADMIEVTPPKRNNLSEIGGRTDSWLDGPHPRLDKERLETLPDQDLQQTKKPRPEISAVGSVAKQMLARIHQSGQGVIAAAVEAGGLLPTVDEFGVTLDALAEKISRFRAELEGRNFVPVDRIRQAVQDARVLVNTTTTGLVLGLTGAAVAGAAVSATVEEFLPAARNISAPAEKPELGLKIIQQLEPGKIVGHLASYAMTAEQEQNIKDKLITVLPDEVVSAKSFNTHYFDPNHINAFSDAWEKGLGIGLQHGMKKDTVGHYAYAMTYATAQYPQYREAMRFMFGHFKGATAIGTYYALSDLSLYQKDKGLDTRAAEEAATRFVLMPVTIDEQLEPNKRTHIDPKAAQQLMVAALQYEYADAKGKNSVEQHIRRFEQRLRVWSGMGAHESGLNTKAKCPTSTALGIGQMLKQTWMQTLVLMAKDKKVTENHLVDQKVYDEIVGYANKIESRQGKYVFRKGVSKKEQNSILRSRADVGVGIGVWTWFVEYNKAQLADVVPKFKISADAQAMATNFWGLHGARIFLQTNPNTPIDKVYDFSKAVNPRTGHSPRMFSNDLIKRNYWILQKVKLDSHTGKPVINHKTGKPVRVIRTVGEVVQYLETGFAVHGPAFARLVRLAEGKQGLGERLAVKIDAALAAAQTKAAATLSPVSNVAPEIPGGIASVVLGSPIVISPQPN